MKITREKETKPKTYKPIIRDGFFGMAVAEVMSNFDHEIDNKIAKQLKEKNLYAKYPSMEFNGNVWYDKKKKTFMCEVWRYHSVVDTVSGTLEEIMETLSDLYGGN